MPKSNFRSANSGTEWYAVFVRSNFEACVAQGLESIGFDVFYPNVAEIHQWKDRQKKVAVPLFPGYIFSRFEPTPANQVKVLQTRGVVTIVGEQSRPWVVDSSQIESVRRMVDSGVQLSRHPLLGPGAWVRITRGPLRGLEGSFLRHRDTWRLFVTVELLGQSVSTEVRLQGVEILRPAPMEGALANKMRKAS